MIEKGKLSVRQFTILVFMFTLGTSVIAIPALAAAFAHENGWVSILIASLVGMGIIFILNQINSIDEKKNLFELTEFVFGKWLGKGISFVMILFILFMTSGNLRQIGDFITAQVMVETPIHTVMVIFILTSLVGVKLGIEVIGRTSEIILPYAIISLILLIVLVSPQIDITKIQPVLQKNIDGMLLSVFPLLSTSFLELFVFLAIMPYVNKPKPARHAFYLGVGIASFILVAITFMCLAVLGVDFTARNLYPTYILGKKISVAQFLERIEILVAIAWFFTIFFKIIVNYYVLSLGFSQLFNLKNAKILATPLAGLLVVMGVFQWPNIIYYQEVLAYYWPAVAATFGLILPLTMLLIGKIKKKHFNKLKRDSPPPR